MYYASVAGHADVAQWALSNGADPHAIMKVSLRSALDWASMNGYENIALLLLEEGERRNEKKCTRWQRTLDRSLIYAAAGGWVRIAQALINHGARNHLNLRADHNNLKDLPIAVAAKCGQVELVSLLLEHYLISRNTGMFNGTHVGRAGDFFDPSA